jgi:hypothetical protein
MGMFADNNAKFLFKELARKFGKKAKQEAKRSYQFNRRPLTSQDMQQIKRSLDSKGAGSLPPRTDVRTSQDIQQKDWRDILKQLTREQMLRNTRVLRERLYEYLLPDNVRDMDKRNEFYRSMNWRINETWQEYNFINDMIIGHSNNNERAKDFLKDFMSEELDNPKENDLDKRISEALSRYITLVTGIPRPKSTEEQRRLKEQEQQRIAQSRQRPSSRKKGQRKNKNNNNPKGGGGGKRMKQRDIDSSARAYNNFKNRKK